MRRRQSSTLEHLSEHELAAKLEPDLFPKHVAVIMDGNGRWAELRGLPRIAGHRAGIQSVREVITYCLELGIQALPASAIQWVLTHEQETAHFDKLHLTVALSYGGRSEITDAAKQLLRDVQEGKLLPSDIDESRLHQYLYTHDLPDPDLLIRTSGETRISNFLLWQLAYTELYFTPTLWPDFRRREFLLALHEYQRRDRRFGRVLSALSS